MTLNGLIGRRGHLKTLKEYWIVGRFILISALAKDLSRGMLAAEQMFLLHPPQWYLRSVMKDLNLLNHMMNCQLFSDEVIIILVEYS